MTKVAYSFFAKIKLPESDGPLLPNDNNTVRGSGLVRPL